MEYRKRCRICKSPTRKTQVEHPYWERNELLVVVSGVPSWVCQLCGRRYFDPAVETTLQVIAQDYAKMGMTFPIPTVPYRKEVQPHV